MKTVLVTGAGGYIGSVLVPTLLKENTKVIAFDRFLFGKEKLPCDHPNLSLVEGDIRSIDINSLKGVSAVIDLAALSNDPAGELSPDITWQINHKGRVRVANLAKKAGVSKYILPSSCSIYGFQEGIVDELSQVNPLTTYAKANYKAEEDIMPLSDDGFCVTILRQATVYGLSPRMRFDLAINGMVKGFITKGTIPILRDGSQWRPFVHVKDTTRAMKLILETPSTIVNNQIFNVGSDDQNIQIISLAKTVAKSMKLPFKYQWYGDPDHRSYRVSYKKIFEKIGFTPKYHPKDGVVEIANAIKSGQLDTDDPKTITVNWYTQLIKNNGIEL